MTDKEKLDKLIAEIERRRNEIKKEELSFDNYATGWHDGNLDLLCDLLSFIYSLQEEPTSVWHDKEEKPDIQRRIVAICYMDIPRAGYYNEINPRLIKYWAYIDDLLIL